MRRIPTRLLARTRLLRSSWCYRETFGSGRLVSPRTRGLRAERTGRCQRRRRRLSDRCRWIGRRGLGGSEPCDPIAAGADRIEVADGQLVCGQPVSIGPLIVIASPRIELIAGGGCHARGTDERRVGVG